MRKFLVCVGGIYKRVWVPHSIVLLLLLLLLLYFSSLFNCFTFMIILCLVARFVAGLFFGLNYPPAA